MSKATPQQILDELSNFMFATGITIVKSANADNKLVVSILSDNGQHHDYEFDEDITETKIAHGEFIKL